MLAGRVMFFEGAVQVVQLCLRVGGAFEPDEDFGVFRSIASETDHWPLNAQRHLWSAEALAKLQPEMEHYQAWAQPFAARACERLIARFADSELDG